MSLTKHHIYSMTYAPFQSLIAGRIMWRHYGFHAPTSASPFFIKRLSTASGTVWCFDYRRTDWRNYRGAWAHHINDQRFKNGLMRWLAIK